MIPGSRNAAFSCGGVEAHEQHTHSAGGDPRLAKYVRQRHAGPFGVADGAGAPRWAPREPIPQEVEYRPVVAGTLQVAHEAAAEHAANVLIGDLQRLLDSVALHAQAPRRDVDIGGPLPVLQHLEEPVGRERAPLELEPSLQGTTGMNDKRLGVPAELRRIRTDHNRSHKRTPGDAEPPLRRQ